MDSGSGHTDIAALAGGVVAVVVSLYLGPGQYSVINFAVSFTLIVVILAYVWASPRPWLQSLAVAAAIGSASIPGIGFTDEVIRSDDPVAFLRCGQTPCTGKEGESNTNQNDIALGWLLVTVVTLSADRHRQQGLGKSKVC
jgi:hypothetical protein